MLDGSPPSSFSGSWSDRLSRAWRRTTHELLDALFPPPPPCALCRGPAEVNWDSRICDRCLARLPLIGRMRCRRCGRATTQPERPAISTEPGRISAHSRKTPDPDSPGAQHVSRARCSPRPKHSLRAAPSQLKSVMGRLLSRPILLCSECRKHPSPLDHCRAVGVYEGYLRRWVHRLKFQGDLEVAQGLGELMAWVVAADGTYGPIQRVVPVPLHPVKQRERGFNQAQALAQVVADQLGKRLMTPVVRTEETAPQGKVAWHERRANVRHAFFVPRPQDVRGKHLLVVDDVYTTGATLSALALVLKRAGARRVTAVCAAASSLTDEFAREEAPADYQ